MEEINAPVTAHKTICPGKVEIDLFLDCGPQVYDVVGTHCMRCMYVMHELFVFVCMYTVYTYAYLSVSCMC